MHIDIATGWEDIELLSYNFTWKNNNSGGGAVTKFSLRNLLKCMKPYLCSFTNTDFIKRKMTFCTNIDIFACIDNTFKW